MTRCIISFASAFLLITFAYPIAELSLEYLGQDGMVWVVVLLISLILLFQSPPVSWPWQPKKGDPS
jgi:hypothetical protein